MQITEEIFKSYLFCQYKAYLKIRGETGTKTEFEVLNEEFRQELKRKAIQHIIIEYAPIDILQTPLLKIDDLKKGKKIILQPQLESRHIRVDFFALEKTSEPSLLGSFSYTPIILNENRKITTTIRRMLTFQAVCLERLQGLTPQIGKIISRDARKKSSIKLDTYFSQVRKAIQGIQKQYRDNTISKLMLNKHCETCEFKKQCRKKAIEADDLSLLSGMQTREIRRQNKKGIFTITQYSYTFRARKKRKRVKEQKTFHFSSLKALAIRENKIYIYEKPQLPDARVRMYLDIEGDPDQSLEYLIGLLIVKNGSTKMYSYWADTQENQKTIFNQLFSDISQYENPRIFHYGNYERKCIEKINKKFEDFTADTIIECFVNVFSLIHSNIYLPTYSNKLKDIARYLGFQWTVHNASGLLSIMWRRKWEVTKDNNIKQKLVTYNHEDCLALKKVTEFVDQIICDLNTENLDARGIEYAQNIPATMAYHFQKPTFAFSDLKYINQCAYFEYQREKVFIRTNKYLRKSQKKQIRTIKKVRRVNEKKCIDMNECPNCGSKDLRSTGYPWEKNVFDFKFFQSGIRKWIIQYSALSYKCKQCGQRHIPPKYKHLELYEHGLAAWCTYQYVANRMTYEHILHSLFDMFNYQFSLTEIYRLKSRFCQFYRVTYQNILDKLISGEIIHADETEIKLKKDKGYVWVFTNMEEAIYMYKPTREGDFLQELLENFHGILISDFYPAYDSINCPQQKCLVHLIRDLNTDLLLNPFDDEYKAMVKYFATLLRKIVGTIDKYGLKKRHLHKHKKEVNTFFEQLAKRNYDSELAIKYQKRFIKNSNKLFTFLEYDSVPWNNANAENSIKAFAKYRANVSGKVEDSGIKEYLVMLSIYQTCKYKNSNFFDFLISRNTDIYTYFECYRRAF